MLFTQQQLWQQALERLMLVDTQPYILEEDVNAFLSILPRRLTNESYLEWLKRGQKLGQIISFPEINFRYLTDIRRLAADSRKTADALPQKPLLSTNKQFRLTVQRLKNNKIKLIIEALGLASGRYAHCLIGISAQKDKNNLISLIRLDEYGEGIDELENSQSFRQALLSPIIGLIEESHNA